MLMQIYAECCFFIVGGIFFKHFTVNVKNSYKLAFRTYSLCDLFVMPAFHEKVSS